MITRHHHNIGPDVKVSQAVSLPKANSRRKYLITLAFQKTLVFGNLEHQ